MGLIRATLKATRSTLAEQWKDYFYCEAMDQDTLVVEGIKNNRSSDNVITDGSKIVVADGQCMIIVDQGIISEVCAEAGEFVYDSSSEPSFFDKSLGEGVNLLFNKIAEKLKYGGYTPKEAHVYFFNLKEIMDNKFGTATPIMFRVLDKNIGLDIDVSIRCNGIYSYKITNPLLFYANVCGNFEGRFDRDQIDAQLKTEFINALQPALAKISALGIRPSEVPAHVNELISALNEELNAKWENLRGISVVNIAMNPISLSPEDAEMIKNYQKVGMLRNPEMGAANLLDAQAEAMKSAAKNASGAAYGFMNMDMASQAGGNNVQGMYERVNAAKQTVSGNTWKCSCGTETDGNFCPNCGSPRPVAKKAFCPNCGKEVSGDAKFCPNCGKAIQ